MKTHEITTSKGEFVVVDLPNVIHIEIHQGFAVLSPSGIKDIEIKKRKISRGDTKGFIHVGDVKLICKLSEATEEDAKLIVEGPQYGHYINYGYSNPALKWVRTALESLHSLIKSKGIDVNNGNWYLFKKI